MYIIVKDSIEATSDFFHHPEQRKGLRLIMLTKELRLIFDIKLYLNDRIFLAQGLLRR